MKKIIKYKYSDDYRWIKVIYDDGSFDLAKNPSCTIFENGMTEEEDSNRYRDTYLGWQDLNRPEPYKLYPKGKQSTKKGFLAELWSDDSGKAAILTVALFIIMLTLVLLLLVPPSDQQNNRMIACLASERFSESQCEFIAGELYEEMSR